MKTVQAQLTRGYARWEAHLTGMHNAPAVVAASGISLRLWRLYAQAWLICLLFPVLTLIQRPLTVAQLLLASAGLAIFVACYTRIMWSHPLHSTRDHVPIRVTMLLIVSLTALVLVLAWAYGGAFLWLLVGISALAGVLLPARSAFVAVMVLTLLTLGAGISMAGGLRVTDWLHLIPLVLLVRGLGLDMAGLARLASALREVHAARDKLARMAVIEERLRMARDLHDLLGQSLSMIALKSELAERLVGQDPARAAQEIGEVAQAARQTLREVRAAVAGYRQPSLRGELEGARQLLEAAGIDHTIEQAAEILPVAIDVALAWAVREGVTNVIRHSRARWCRVRIAVAQGVAFAEVTNDDLGGIERDDVDPRAGSGLAGLAERVAAQGGRLAAGPQGIDERSFRLWVELPIAPGSVAGPEPWR